MWRLHLVVALRALAAQPLFTAINLVGLAVGMAACTLIALWVGHETGHDRWVPLHEQVFVVQSQTQYPGREAQTWRHSPAPMLPRLQQDFASQISAASRYVQGQRAMRVGQQVANQAVVLVDAGFFDVLPWPVAAGSTRDAFAQPGRMVVTPAFVRKWFGHERLAEVVGQAVQVTLRGQPQPVTIAAVLQPLAAASIFDFDVLMLLNPAEAGNPAVFDNWGAFNALALVRLKQPADAAALGAGAEAFVARHQAPFVNIDNGFWYRPRLVPLADAHLRRVAIGGPGKPPGDATLVAAMAAVGLAVLLIATLTYINLATARASMRSREVGLRKALGASRRQLVAQFLVESTLLALLAALLALALVEVALPAFNALLGQQLALAYFGPRGTLLPLAAAVLFVGLVGGWYPALVLARQRPREALLGQLAAGGAPAVRQALMVGQFAIAVALMSCMAVIYAQVLHLRQADMGYQPEGLMVIGALNRAEIQPHQRSLLEAVRRVPGVVAVTRSMFDPSSGGLTRQPAYLPGRPDAQAPQVEVQPIDWNYLETYGARLLAGRGLSADAGDDVEPLSDAELASRGVRVLVNRAALVFFDTTDPQQAIGRTFQIGSEPRITATVVGVIENLRIRSGRDAPEPAFYVRDPQHVTTLSLRFAGVPAAQMHERLQTAWHGLFPNSPFVATLADDAIEAYYRAEARAGHLFALFSVLAIVLCAAGLYGLTVFATARKRREIGLRKALGATRGDIVRLLLTQFTRPLLLSLLLAWPPAAWLMARWLSGFDLRIALSPWPFVAAGGLALLIAAITITVQARQAAQLRPVQVLRDE